MRIYNPEFDVMRQQMQAWIDRNRENLSAEEARAAELVVLSLGACAMNREPLGVLLKMLGEYTEAFNKARAR